MGALTSAPAQGGSGPRRARLDLQLVGRRALLLVIAAVVVTAVLAGLARLGVVTSWGASHAGEHGPLFVVGVFGTVIALERAVALARPWSFSAPVLGALAAVGMIAGARWAPWVAAASSAALVAVNVAVVQKQSAPFTWLMLLGSCVLAFGNALWSTGRPVFDVVFTWMAFFVLTIAAERLELSRLAPTPRWATRALVVLGVSFAALAALRALGVAGSARLFGVAMALVAAWQLRFDLARCTWRQRGVPRYAATGVLLGAAWLFADGVLFASVAIPPVGPLYDAALHAVLLGYVLSMVFAHAPIILPAVARVSVPFSASLYVPVVVLQAGLLARVVGDLVGHALLRQAGGVANALALVLFLLAVVHARRARRVTSARGARR